MTASVTWQVSDSTNATANWLTSVSTIRFKTAADNVDDLNNPNVRPATGSGLTNYSFTKPTRIFIGPNSGGTAFSSLSSLTTKLSTGTIGANIGGALNQAYSFQAAYIAATGAGPMASHPFLGTTPVAWTGAVASTAAGNQQWASSNFLYFQLEIGEGNGGTATSWNTIASYNEV